MLRDRNFCVMARLLCLLDDRGRSRVTLETAQCLAEDDLVVVKVGGGGELAVVSVREVLQLDEYRLPTVRDLGRLHDAVGPLEVWCIGRFAGTGGRHR